MQRRAIDPPRPPQRIGDILSGPGVVAARCASRACAAVTALEVGPGLYGALRGASLRRLEEALRCTCGGRGGGLEAWPVQLAPAAGGHRLYLFVI